MSVLQMVRDQEAALVSPASVREEPPQGGLRGTRELMDLKERLKRELVRRLGLEVVASMASSADSTRARGELSVACQAILRSGDFSTLGPHERGELEGWVLDDICGLGPLQPLLDDDSVTEVMVNGREGLFFEREGRIHPARAVFDSDEQILMVVDRILAPLGRRFDRNCPIVNARLANGDRVNAVSPPIAIDGPMVTIRKFSNRISTLGRLVELGSLPDWYAQLLSWAVRLRQDVAVAGGTGSGKTTLLNALSCEIPPSERIVTIEDSAELKFDSHPNVVRLEARTASIEGSGEISIRDLVKNALRMRPDRIVVGEVRGEEAIDMLQAMNTGHDGSLTTLHAGTAQEAVLRLVLMARFGMDLPTDIIEEQIATALDFLVMSQRLPDGRRVIASLNAVTRKGSGGVRLEEAVRFDEASRCWNLGFEPAFVGRGLEEGVLDEGEVALWRRRMSLA
ncbi:CpaF family protein [Olsenella sp. DNF00959]|uniref:CpaF family protein n=1 Tax=Olsenella TaxID=133925 RepID=UPI0007802190|nr:CpaF family protein [Olsenella sp. DNF00959]KXB63274.1 type II/IV secretion system protein [Olsenella sp. DNF00959]